MARKRLDSFINPYHPALPGFMLPKTV
ncbi:hypothetical protein CGRA01v4_05107 [Colletotrichum graminicola]|nr:hypothetical protein CGRA01v4_05107 [Colletotrichum graminicola]